MNQVNRPEQSSAESGVATHWSAGWLPTMERSGQRMQQFQHAAQDLQKAVNEASVDQIQDMFAAISQISTAVNDATRESSVAGVFNAQPRVLECMMQITHKSNERLMHITERVNACTLAIANGAGEQPGGDGAAAHQSNRSGETGQSPQPSKRAAAAQEG